MAKSIDIDLPPTLVDGIFVPPTNTAMARCLRALKAPSRVVDGIVFRMREGVDGDVWSDLVDPDDDVWSRRDPQDRAAWESPRLFTQSFDVALTCKFAGIRLASLEETQDDDSHPWRCELAIAGLRRAGEEKFIGLGINPAIALLDAMFQVNAMIAGEERS